MSKVEFYYNMTSSTAPLLSIRTTGCISFNKSAMEKFGLQHGMFFLLGYDRNEKKIVLKPAKPNEIGAKKLHSIRNCTSIISKGFLNYFEIDFSICRKFQAIQNKDKSIKAFLSPQE